VNEYGLKKLGEICKWKPVYQLIRQYIYACQLAQLLDKKPLVFPLINQEHVNYWQKNYQPLMDINAEIFQPFILWQDIPDIIAVGCKEMFSISPDVT